MKSRRFWPLASIILLPVLVLAGVAAYGLRTLAAQQLSDEERRLFPLLDKVEKIVESELRLALANSPPVFLEPGPPAPAASSAEADTLEGLSKAVAAGNLEGPRFQEVWLGLKMLRDDRDLSQSQTAAGLPVRTMAAWYAWKLTQGEDDGKVLARLCMEEPSILSFNFMDRLMQEAEEKMPGAEWIRSARDGWQMSLNRRWVLEAAVAPTGTNPHHDVDSDPFPYSMLASAPSTAEGSYAGISLTPPADVPPGEYYLRAQPRLQWYVTGPANGDRGLWLVDLAHDASDDSISKEAWRTVSPQEMRAITDRVFSQYAYELPVWAAFHSAPLEDTLDHSRARGERKAVSFGVVVRDTAGTYSPKIGIYVRDYDLYTKTTRRLKGWVAGLLSGALFTALLGLWLVRRTLNKERRLGELKSQFVSSVSHELRAPIGSLRLMAEGLASGRVKGAAAGEFHRLMAGEGARLSSLIENVLDFARIEQGRKEYVMAETDMAALLGDAVALMQPQAEAKRLHILLECEPLPCVPRVDAGAVQQAVINLLDNAVKFTPPVAGAASPHSSPDATGGQDAPATVIRVRLAPESAGWAITVTDPGPGIPAAEHARIFERFYRLGNELRRETTGTGIGLALVKHIAEGHGGRVTVESAVGQGSTFTLRFPVLLVPLVPSVPFTEKDKKDPRDEKDNSAEPK